MWRRDPSLAYLRTTTGRPPRDGIRVNRASNSSGIGHQARGCRSGQAFISFRSVARHSSFLSLESFSLLYYFVCRGLNFIFVFLPCSDGSTRLYDTVTWKFRSLTGEGAQSPRIQMSVRLAPLQYDPETKWQSGRLFNAGGITNERHRSNKLTLMTWGC